MLFPPSKHEEVALRLRLPASIAHSATIRRGRAGIPAVASTRDGTSHGLWIQMSMRATFIEASGRRRLTAEECGACRLGRQNEGRAACDMEGLPGRFSCLTG